MDEQNRRQDSDFDNRDDQERLPEENVVEETEAVNGQTEEIAGENMQEEEVDMVEEDKGAQDEAPMENRSQEGNSSQMENRSGEQVGHSEEKNAHEQVAASEMNDSKRMVKKRGGGFFNMIAAAVIGSALTLGVVSQTDLLQVEPEVQEIVKESSAPVSGSKPVASDAMDITDVIEHSTKTIVGITNIGKQENPFQQSGGEVKQGTGSGVIYDVTDDAAYIITNHHVIDGANKVSVSLYDGETVDAKLVGTDPLTDTAVIKISGDYDITPLAFGDSDNVRSGESVIAIGNPLGLELSRTVTQGIISAVDRSINVQTSAGDWELDVIQTDAAINPGNSGGALINSQGELIGINSLKIASNNVEGLGFAIPSNDVKTIVEQLRENGQVERAYLGVGLQDVRAIPSFYMPSLPDQVKSGAIVVSVDQQSAAGQAGLQEEDIIVKMNDFEIESDKDVRRILYKEAEIGDKIKLTVFRDGKKQTIEVTLTSNLTDQLS